MPEPDEMIDQKIVAEMENQIQLYTEDAISFAKFGGEFERFV